jgi:hypothetical protein
MIERSTREVETLIDELQRLGKKLDTDSDRIQSEIARHSELSQGGDATDRDYFRQCEKTA